MQKFIASYPSMMKLAERIVSYVGERHVALPWVNIQWEQFDDGTPKLFVQSVAKLRGAHVFFLMDPDLRNLFEQYAMIRMLARSGLGKVTVILPFLATGTMDRVQNEGEVASAIGHARLLSTLPGTDSHKTTIAIVDIHNLSERGFFTDDITLDLLSNVPSDDLYHWDNTQMNRDAVIMFPDDGAFKRFRDSFPGRDKARCEKVRDRGQITVTIADSPDLAGRDVLIVDDLIQSGKTLVASAKAAHNADAKSVCAYATHGVLPGNARDRLTSEHFQSIWITDSIPDRNWGGKLQRQVSLAPLLAKYILGL